MDKTEATEYKPRGPSSQGPPQKVTCRAPLKALIFLHLSFIICDKEANVFMGCRPECGQFT